MRTWALLESPAGYTLTEARLPGPGPTEVKVELVVSALNHLDLWLQQGLPKPKTFPMVPGCDGAGRVVAMGEGVTRWQLGDEVVINPSFACGRCPECLADRSVFCAKWGIMGEHYWGSHGQYVIAGEANLVPKPPGLSWEEAGAYGLCGLTAYRMLRRARLSAGEALLVVGAGGGVASAAVGIGQRLGARVFATSRDEAKCERALALGAVEAFVTRGEPVPVKADVVLDSAGSPTWSLSVRALKPGGRLVTCGGTGGVGVEVNLARLFLSQHEVIGSTMGTFKEFDEVTALVATGVPVVVDSVYDLEEYPAALERLESGAQFGKVVLRH